MKSALIALIFLALLFIAACEDRQHDYRRGGDDAEWWYYAKSPLTGRCYEIMKHIYNQSAYGGMAEVPCERRVSSEY